MLLPLCETQNRLRQEKHRKSKCETEVGQAGYPQDSAPAAPLEWPVSAPPKIEVRDDSGSELLAAGGWNGSRAMGTTEGVGAGAGTHSLPFQAHWPSSLNVMPAAEGDVTAVA